MQVLAINGIDVQQVLPQSDQVLGTKGGNLTKSFVSQLPSLEFGWIEDSLLEGSAQCMTAGKIAAAERELVVEVKRGVYSQPRRNHAVSSFWSRYSHI